MVQVLRLLHPSFSSGLSFSLSLGVPLLPVLFIPISMLTCRSSTHLQHYIYLSSPATLCQVVLHKTGYA